MSLHFRPGSVQRRTPIPPYFLLRCHYPHVKNSRPRGLSRFMPSQPHLSQSDEGVVLERAERVVGQVEEVEATQPGEAAPLHHRDLVPAQLEVRQEDVRRKSGLHHADPA